MAHAAAWMDVEIARPLRPPTRVPLLGLHGAEMTAATALSRLSIARSKALADVQTIWQGDRIMVGDFTGAEVVAYHVGAAEWDELMDAVKELVDAN